MAYARTSTGAPQPQQRQPLTRRTQMKKAIIVVVIAAIAYRMRRAGK
ncbi:MAG: hypothetical protein V1875_05030 [Candidatus Altiarchaeota archaeon]